ncbi:methyltransferase [uncultured Brevundimonas sp.]|uniref:class I SAM-dependent methyltransferase n=1 Tax=uncultured Brevundimonas sp. TaxID=213418 RepID=UPI0030EB1942|tara:strand:+ start:729 stop:1490 length:762 start_codon:yes stop_codon:yes gene_type:complete
MRRSLFLAATAALALSTAIAGPVAAQSTADTVYAAALADPVRTDADRARDAARHTAETLAFAEVGPGQSIGDMIIGGGYFTRVFSAAVGPEGHVTGWQPAEFVAFAAVYGQALVDIAELPNVTAIDSPLATPAWPEGLDLIFTAQNYHDLHLDVVPPDTAARINAAAFAALKPGGLYVIVDHVAAAGSSLEVADSQHRIDPATVRAEVEAAGFVLDAEDDTLINPDDPLTANVFDPSIRGHTSQFMLRFRKPG